MIKATGSDPISYAGYRFPPEVISYAVWLYFRFPLREPLQSHPSAREVRG